MIIVISVIVTAGLPCSPSEEGDVEGRAVKGGLTDGRAGEEGVERRKGEGEAEW